MTQKLYSGSASPYDNDAANESLNQESTEGQSSSEIRADIDQTRASVGEKIDQLQARLDPNRLKQQAQETVQEMLSDTANSMTDYVRSHKDEMVNSLADAARRNPLPTALVGVGIGWLILESLTGNRHKESHRYDPRTDPYSDAPRYDPRYAPRFDARSDPRLDEQRWREAWGDASAWQSGRFEGSTGRSQVAQGRGPSGEAYYSSEYYNAPDYGNSGYPVGYEQGRYEQSRYEQSRYEQGQYANGGYAGSSNQGQSGNGNQSGNPISKATDAVKDTISGAADAVKDAAGQVKDKLSDATQQVKDSVSGTTQQVQEGMSNVGGRMGDTMGDMRHQMSDQMDRMGEQGQRTMRRAGAQMNDWQERARYESWQARQMAERRGRQLHHNLEDNPLIYGAVALAAGAALALLLPRTRAENRFFGEMRDQMMDRGQEFMETAQRHAANVVEEVRPELEQKARQIVSDVTETGKEAVKSAADELKPVMDKAVAKGKEEARSAAQEVGVNPDKLTLGNAATGSSMTSSSASPSTTSSGSSSGSSSGGSASAGNKSLIINRDTMKGQWKQVKGEVKKQWGQLTDDDLMKIEGNYDKLVGSIQERYGYTRERIEREINAFFDAHKS